MVDHICTWQNLPDDYYGVRVGRHSFVQDPLFAKGVRGDYYLSNVAAGQPATSPCVDAGNTVARWIDSLLRLWTTRTDSVPDIGALDIGYHYCWERSVGIGSGRGSITRNQTSLLVPVGSALVLPSKECCRFPLSDPLGRKVAMLGGGHNDISRLPAGIYFQSGETGIARVMIVR